MFGEFPLSSYATDEVYKMVFLTTILALCSSVIPWILWPARRAAITRRKYLITHLEAYLTGAVGLVGTSLFVFYDGRHIVSENAKDYRISVAMAQALATFESAPLTNDPEGDQELVGAWQPFGKDPKFLTPLLQEN
ncbi:MAG: hypothetical protein HYV34_04375 [Candidatus Kerfeldbacteria bacterium]|nr:hypothetical protein [Candidatus Kerfeldbacteria bacterium]